MVVRVCVGPAMDRRPVRGVTYLSPRVSRDWLQLPCDPQWIDRYGNGWLNVCTVHRNVSMSIWHCIVWIFLQATTFASSPYSLRLSLFPSLSHARAKSVWASWPRRHHFRLCGQRKTNWAELPWTEGGVGKGGAEQGTVPSAPRHTWASGQPVNTRLGWET